MLKNYLLSIVLVFAILLSSPSLGDEPGILQKRSNETVELDISSDHGNNQVLINFVIPKGVVVYSNLHGHAGTPMEIGIENGTNIKSHRIHFPASVIKNNNGLATYVYEKNTQVVLDLVAEDSTLPMEFLMHIRYSSCGATCEILDEKEHIFLNAGDAIYQKNNVHNILWMILAALLGGFILNLMPCVFPVLSIKIFSILNSPNFSKREIKMQMLATIFGIVTSFLILAVGVSVLKSFGQAVGWGLHFQNPFFLSSLVLIIIIFANNLWGTFEVNLPTFFNNKISNIGTSPGIISNFLAGVLATLLATPCTAPFLSTSIAFALSQNYLTIILIYLFVGIGMSFPYILLAIFPSALSFLPKPGKWMVVFKKILALLLLLTAIWLISILFFHLKIKGTLIFLGLMVILQAFLSNPLKINHLFKKVLIGCVILMILLLPNFIAHQESEHIKKVQEYWIPFDQSALNNLIESDKVILVDVTADWCLTCKFNKIFVLDQIDVLEFLKEKEVIMMRADYTNRSEEIAKFLKENNRYGIPFNIVYSSKLKSGIILPEILTKRSIINAVESVSHTRHR